jgi:hypothetical protein
MMERQIERDGQLKVKGESRRQTGKPLPTLPANRLPVGYRSLTSRLPVGYWYKRK